MKTKVSITIVDYTCIVNLYANVNVINCNSLSLVAVDKTTK